MATRLWSLWDMVKTNARPFANMLHSLIEMERLFAKQRGKIPPEIREQMRAEATAIAKFCEELAIPMGADAVLSLPTVETFSQLEAFYGTIRNIIFLALNRRTFFEPEVRYGVYFENPKLFGDSVFNAFPSATDDIAEAGTCLALERATACVMHLMRATEAALKALAQAVGVPAQNDWGAYIREIYKELEKQVKAAGAQTADHQFYAEVAAQIDNVKRAWRNPTMHVDKSYSQQRAEEILLATKSLMTHLAARISE